MSNSLTNTKNRADMLDSAIQSACDSISPNWPLDRMIAVNPYWSLVDRPFDQVAHQLATLAGSSMAMPLAYYAERWQNGDISPRDLDTAIALLPNVTGWDSQRALAALQSEDVLSCAAPLLCDVLDSQRDLHKEPAWCDTITHQVAQFCAAYFDHDQADWHPSGDKGLYPSWRDSLRHDHSVALLMKAPHIPSLAPKMASTARAQIHAVLTQLNIAESQWQDYLQAVIYRVSGWAAWCAYQKWQASFSQLNDETIVDLLAIRLSWEWILDDKARHSSSLWQHWQTQWNQHFQHDHPAALEARLIWLRAHEISYQRHLNHTLAQPTKAIKTSKQIQAVFCIDVRSEVIRRHLEAQSEAIETLGFAGFFGLPASYTPIGTDIKRPQLPGLLAPSFSICDSSGCKTQDALLAEKTKQRLQSASSWSLLNAMPASNFTLVETLGLGYVSKLIKRTLSVGSASDDKAVLSGATLRPTLVANLEQQVTLAENVLKGMGLVRDFAPFVLLVGHGSENANNPQRAGLDCGACCGQTGEVNTRALAQLLNTAAVRQSLASRGIEIAASTQFVAALHNTTTDSITLFDTDLLEHDAKMSLPELQATLEQASCAARQERALPLGLEPWATKPKQLQQKIEKRSQDWSQTRPEWGLANNAAFIIAPRALTRGIKLDGRTFLHEYHSEQDPEANLLAQIMTAPMVVTHWINMQYFASTVDNLRYGSGNKTLHNVVGGRLGVFEGNGGDLRIGLALQSLHDGKQWRHDPLRLTVVIDAPEQSIERVIREHPIVQQLVDNQWLYLARVSHQSLAFYQQGQWHAWFAD